MRVRLTVVIAGLIGLVPIAIVQQRSFGVLSGVTCAGRPVSAISYAETKVVVGRIAEELANRPLLLRTEQASVSVSARRLGLEPEPGLASARIWLRGHEPSNIARTASRIAAWRGIDISVPFRVSDAYAMRRVLRKMERPSRNARFFFDAGTLQCRIAPEAVGSRIDTVSSLRRIQTALACGSSAVDLITEVTVPTVTAESLRSYRPLASTVVPITSPHPGALQNARQAVRLMGAVSLPPNQPVSISQAVGPRTAKRGFVLAPGFVNNHTALVRGAGLCYISTAVFQATAKSGFEIPQRYNHSEVVRYASAGMDATIASGAGKDLVVCNRGTHPAVLLMACRGRKVYARVYGIPDGMHYRLAQERKRSGKWLVVTTYRICGTRREVLCRSRYKWKE